MIRLKRLEKIDFFSEGLKYFIYILNFLIFLLSIYAIILSGAELKEGVDILTNSIIFGGVFGFVFFIFKKWFGL